MKSVHKTIRQNFISSDSEDWKYTQIAVLADSYEFFLKKNVRLSKCMKEVVRNHEMYVILLDLTL